jgi:tungstate transport system ATP-binding protein
MNSIPLTAPQFALEASNLSIILGGKKVLEISSLQVRINEVLVIIGPNGSGKTTLLLSLALLLKPASGAIFYQGHSINNTAEVLGLRRRLAVVFQEPLLLNTTVWNNITLGLRVRKISREEIKARTEKWLQRFGIASLAQRQAKTLSGGEAKRVSLARAFALQPDVLFLDEPFNGVDSPTRQALMEDFGNVLRETNVTTVMVTHDRNEALMMAHRVMVLMNGRIRQVGTPSQVFSYPVDEEVASFVEAGNIMHGSVISQTEGLASVDVGGLQLEAVSELSAGTRVTMFLHDDDITLSLLSPQTNLSSARNQYTGKVVKAFPIGSQIRVTVDCGIPLVALITRRSWEELGLKQGQIVITSFKASSIHLIPHK